jgi:hypothetical protein
MVSDAVPTPYGLARWAYPHDLRNMRENGVRALAALNLGIRGFRPRAFAEAQSRTFSAMNSTPAFFSEFPIF